MTRDFQQCGILTSVDSDEPLQSPFRLGTLKWCSVSSFTLIGYSSDKQMLWSDCAPAQADLRLSWSQHRVKWSELHAPERSEYRTNILHSIDVREVKLNSAYDSCCRLWIILKIWTLLKWIRTYKIENSRLTQFHWVPSLLWHFSCISLFWYLPLLSKQKTRKNFREKSN